jgi:DNA-directed RNA polymerase subunit beta'
MKKLKLNFNKRIDKSELKKLLSWFITNFGSLRTQKLVDELKTLGFYHSTKTGISLGLEDLKIPPTKNTILKNTAKEINIIHKKMEKGQINLLKSTEKINQSWNTANEILKNEVINNFKQTDILNPLYMMTLSGARGNISQIKQLVGMRGLMSGSQGEIINLAIKTNFREGLNVIEYFISCYGARKGLIDTALKTANSGYLTRRLVYSSQNQIIKKSDCFTKKNKLILVVKNTKKNYKITIEKILGRVIAKDIIEDNKKIIGYGQDICNVRTKIKRS